MYMLDDWEGSTHDALIIVDSIEWHDGLRVPPSNYSYLSDHMFD